MPVVLFRCDGSHRLGLGHISRCLTLARVLKAEFECETVFAVREGQEAHKMLGEAGIVVEQAPDKHFDYFNWLQGLIAKYEARTLVIDVRDDLTAETLVKLRKSGCSIALIDDGSVRGEAADASFIPLPVNTAEIGVSTGARIFSGWEWAIVRREFCRCESNNLPSDRPRKLFISMGGSDPHGLVFPVLNALEQICEVFEITLVTGAGFRDHAKLQCRIADTKHRYSHLHNVKNMAEAMVGASIALIAFGVTAYEVAAMGIPALYFSPTPDHAKSAAYFQNANMGVSFGYFAKISETRVAEILSLQIADGVALKNMGETARRLIDGRGATRIAEILVSMSGLSPSNLLE